MKNIRDKIFGAILMYKTSFSINPIITTVGTIVAASFVVSVLKIFGL